MEYLEYLKNYNTISILCILFCLYNIVKWILEQVLSIKKWYDNKLKNYHNIENEKEEKEDLTNERFESIEDKLKADYNRIKDFESNISQISDDVKDLNNKVTIINDMLINLRLESMRGRILDFAPLAIDLTKPQSRERYTEIYKVHSDYVDLIRQTGLDNNFETYNFELIEKSYEQRAEQKLFTEDFHISPGSIIKK